MSSKANRRPQKRQRERAEAIAPTETKALVVVVGLPPALVVQVTPWISNAFGKPVRVIPIPASPDDNDPYRNAQIPMILGNVAGFAKRKQQAEQQPAPSSILLLYVPSHRQEPILAAFDFFVFPIMLATLADFENGKQLRNDPAEVRAAIEAALSPDSPTRLAFEATQQRVGAVRHAEPLQLPPINFHVDKRQPLAAIFRAMRRGERAWSDPVEELVEQEFGHARIPRIPDGVIRRAYQDARGLVFFRADLLAHHGANRQILDEQDEDEEAREETQMESDKRFLRGAFRFGYPLSAGFHHDVQLEDNRLLSQIWFDCDQKGEANTTKARYANIYPNDRVRAKQLKARRKN